MKMPVVIVFWCFVFAYIIHILEESLLPETFVDKVKRLYWKSYSWKKFFGFNAILLILNIIAVILFDTLGGHWIIFPLSLAIERSLNGLYHLGEIVITKKYSSGLLASVMTWILAYWLIRYSNIIEYVSTKQLIMSFILGGVLCGLMIIPLITGLLNKMKIE